VEPKLFFSAPDPATAPFFQIILAPDLDPAPDPAPIPAPVKKEVLKPTCLIFVLVRVR